MGGEFSVEKPASMAAWRKTCYSVSLDKEGCLKWGQEKWVRKRGKWGAQVEHFPRLREWSEAKDFFLFVMSMKITQQHHLQNTSSVKAFILFLEDKISSNIEKKDHWEIGCLKKKDPGGGRHASENEKKPTGLVREDTRTWWGRVRETEPTATKTVWFKWPFCFLLKIPFQVVFARAEIIASTYLGERGNGNVTRLSKIEWILADYKSPFQ